MITFLFKTNCQVIFIHNLSKEFLAMPYSILNGSQLQNLKKNNKDIKHTTVLTLTLGICHYINSCHGII